MKQQTLESWLKANPRHTEKRGNRIAILIGPVDGVAYRDLFNLSNAKFWALCGPYSEILPI